MRAAAHGMAGGGEGGDVRLSVAATGEIWVVRLAGERAAAARPVSVQEGVRGWWRRW